MSYRLATHLTSILCTLIISTALICSAITPPCSTASSSPLPSSEYLPTNRWVSLPRFSQVEGLNPSDLCSSLKTSSKYFFSFLSNTRQDLYHSHRHEYEKRPEYAYHVDFDYGSDKSSRDKYNREISFQIKSNLMNRHRGLRDNEMYSSGSQDSRYGSSGSDRNGYLLLRPHASATSFSCGQLVPRTWDLSGPSARGQSSYAHQHHYWDRQEQAKESSYRHFPGCRYR
ncbi:hypothetical protein BC939DRAFT_76493 [Gamsiella multidivaricata]|uniref:uncharacterized protein n=1 Tax=Gamsiella multidivaricata TaxID=101098 RepID=UPI00221F210C|nr:uncharacterized protein BC939DRAFT_76493 [Gamsiella multidivaricata]KAI7827974.1 hypothetical protein BC939DRAFT_76493 [Gamsiella multidivaricata]